MKKSSPEQPESDRLPSYLDIEESVFTEVKGVLYIGKNPLEPTLRSVLRDEAVAMESSRLWEILNASIVNEAYNLALTQSTNFDQVQFAKAMKHWSVFMMTVIHKLAKKE